MNKKSGTAREACKLTDKNDQTYNDTQWGEGVTHTASGKGELCTAGWIHYYDSPLLAVLLNPIQGNFKHPHLWSAQVNKEIKSGDNLKFGTTSLTTIKRIPLPKLTTTQRIIFGIYCAMEVYHNEEFQCWGKHWIGGSDRSIAAAREAREAAREAAEAAEATWTTADAARAAAEAARVKIDFHALAEKALACQK